jgi:hypothetical protein
MRKTTKNPSQDSELPNLVAKMETSKYEGE